MTNETDNTLHMAPWPTLCDDCGQAMARSVLEREDLDAFTIYCQHRMTFALVFAGQVEGTRGVIKWDVQSPISEADAIEAMRKMAPYAESMENLDRPRLQ